MGLHFLTSWTWHRGAGCPKTTIQGRLHHTLTDPPTKPPSGCWTWNNPTTYWRPHTHSLGSIYSARAEKFLCKRALFYAPLSVLMEFKPIYILCGNFTCTMEMSFIDIDVCSLFFAVISFYFHPFDSFFTQSGCTIFDKNAIKHWLIDRFTESALVVAFPPPLLSVGLLPDAEAFLKHGGFMKYSRWHAVFV